MLHSLWELDRGLALEPLQVLGSLSTGSKRSPVEDGVSFEGLRIGFGEPLMCCWVLLYERRARSRTR